MKWPLSHQLSLFLSVMHMIVTENLSHSQIKGSGAQGVRKRKKKAASTILRSHWHGVFAGLSFCADVDRCKSPDRVRAYSVAESFLLST